MGSFSPSLPGILFTEVVLPARAMFILRNFKKMNKK